MFVKESLENFQNSRIRTQIELIRLCKQQVRQTQLKRDQSIGRYRSKSYTEYSLERSRDRKYGGHIKDVEDRTGLSDIH